MTTYVQSPHNQFETPSGAVGEPPDAPGELAHLRDQIDGRIGIGGAEYCATPGDRDAIPSSRLFPGKKAFVASEKLEYWYTGSAWLVVPSNRLRCTVQQAGVETIPGNVATDITWDSVISDPTGQMAPTDGKNIRCPWGGRYRATFMYALGGSAFAAAQYLGSNFISKSGGTDYIGQVIGHQAPQGYTDMVHCDVAEWTIAAGALLRVQLYFSDGTSRPLSYGDDSHRAKLHVQYLGEQ